MTFNDFVTLNDVKPGETVKILDFNSAINPTFRQRLVNLGIRPGTEMTLIRKAPLGDPLEFRIHHSSICLRAKEAEALQLLRSNE